MYKSKIQIILFIRYFKFQHLNIKSIGILIVSQCTSLALFIFLKSFQIKQKFLIGVKGSKDIHLLLNGYLKILAQERNITPR